MRPLVRFGNTQRWRTLDLGPSAVVTTTACQDGDPLGPTASSARVVRGSAGDYGRSMATRGDAPRCRGRADRACNRGVRMVWSPGLQLVRHAARRSAGLARSARRATVDSAAVFLLDVGHGFLEISHNTLAVMGLMLAALLVFAAGRADLRQEAETWALGWLQARQEARAEPVDPLVTELSEPDAISRATASDPKELNRQQAAVAQWLARRYHVAPEPVSRLVQEAWSVGQKAALDPTLILAIMAVESSFNPFAQSAVGAQGLMQVMTKVHDAKYEAFGGSHAA